MRKKLLLGSILFIICFSVHAQAAWQWARSITGSGGAEVSCIYTASDNSIYVAGSFTGTITIGSDVLISTGGLDAFIAKLNPAGVWQWAIRCGGTGPEKILSLTADSAGNLWVAGYYNQSFALDPYQIDSIGGFDIFYAKLSPDRTWLGAIGLGSTYNDTFGDIAVAPDGSVYVTGQYQSSITIGTNVLNNTSYNGVYIAKYDSALYNLWAIQPNNNGNDVMCGKIGTDEMGNFYLLGSFMYQCAFGNTNPITLFSSQMDAYAVKFSPDGNCVWAEKIGVGSDGLMNGFVDSDGSSYLSCDAVLFPARQESATRLDAIPTIAKFTSAGDCQWYEGNNDLECANNVVSADSGHNSYLAGSLVGVQVFGSSTLTADMMTWQTFVAKASPTGEWEWGLQTYTGGYVWNGAPQIVDVAGAEAGYCVVAGSYGLLGVDFGNLTIPIAQNSSVFIAKGGLAPVSNTDLVAPVTMSINVYPNPSFGRIAVEFNLEKAQPTSLSIYNIKGQLVKSFPQRMLQKGTNSMEWDGCTIDGSRATAGIYLIKVESGNSNTTKLIVRK